MKKPHMIKERHQRRGRMVAINLIVMDDDSELYDEFCKRMNSGGIGDSQVDGIAVEQVFNLVNDYAVKLVSKEQEKDEIEDLKGAKADNPRLGHLEFDTPEAAVSYVRTYIRQHLDDDLDATSLAEMVGLHPSYLSGMFSRMEGITLHQYVLKNRVDKAAYLLETELTPIGDIAERVGFRSISHFIKAFKKRYFLTPKQYRKEKMEALRVRRKAKERRNHDF